MRKLFSVVVLSVLAMAGTVVAQDNPIYLGVTLGYNNFLNANAANIPNAAEAASPSWTDKGAVLGFEAGAYLAPELRVLVGGGFNRTVKPGHAYTPAIYDNAGNMIVPGYGETPNRTNMNYTFFVGGDFCPNMNGNVRPYAGIRGRGAYCLNTEKYVFDKAATIEGSEKKFAETWNLGGAIVFGADYSFSGGLIVGCQFDLFSYTYAAVQYKSQGGVKPNVGRCCSIGFIAAPTLRVGFNF
ncbi:MAG: hypothetical protein IKW77_10560 [Salinivirgaceae bacterium]|nr:hypothetical protein [Salinivirgaceae bacterium]